MKIILLLLCPLIIFGQRHYGTIDQDLLKGVVHIAKGKNIGTGFLVANYETNGVPGTYLVTNKHMIGFWNLCEPLIPVREIAVTFYTREQKQLFRTITIGISAWDGQLLKTVQPHPDQLVDIVLIDITHELIPDLAASVFAFRPEHLKTMAALPGLHVGMGDPVFALGYPSDIRSLTTNLPIAKAAYISSALDDSLNLKVWVTRKDSSWCRATIGGRIFLVDGNIIIGNSGGPIVTGKQPTYAAAGGYLVTESYREKGNVVIGIVSQGMGNTGINIIYGCDYIFELLELYAKFKATPGI